MAGGDKVRRLYAIGPMLAAALLLFGAHPVKAIDVTEGLISCWELDEVSGARYDLANNNDLTDNNTVGSGQGYVNLVAALFDESNSEYLSAVDHPTLTFSEITILAWSKIDAPPASAHIVSKSGSLSFYYDPVTSKYTAAVFNGTAWKYVSDSQVLADTDWHMVLFWYEDPIALHIAVDDVADTTTANADGMFHTAVSLLVGGPSDYDGMLGPLVLWDRVLTEQERAAVWNDGIGVSCAAILANLPASGFGTTQLVLPSGETGSIEYRMTAGDVAIASPLVVLVVLALFFIMQRVVLVARVGKVE